MAECTEDTTLFDGFVCDNTVQVRRISFHDFAPLLELRGMSMYISNYDQDFQTQLAADEALRDEFYFNKNATHKKDYYSTVKFKDKLDPVNSWTFPFVTGHEYKIHWVNTGVDFTKMKLTMSDRWLDSDRPIILHHNHTDVRV